DVLTLRDSKIEQTKRTEVTGSDKGKLIPTDIGAIVNDFLTEYFPDILDFNFTAHIEEKFDEIAKGNIEWAKVIGDFYTMFHPAVDSALTINGGPKFGERKLGTDPATGQPVSVKIGRFGPVVQIGGAEGDEKPRFASLLKGQSISEITLEEALRLFEFPRVLGQLEGHDVTVAVGRFGPYVRHDGKFVSIPKDMAPAELTLEQAEELIMAKRQADNERILRTYDEDADLAILNGRFGPYISYRKKNYKIPRTVENPAELTRDQAMEIIAAADAAPAKPRRTTKKK
ncbi:MAG: DNA topoisomerase I, partial [Muribaculaceae bacterium]|nr:DNA topoisomerase I [Muribaculaceae bacterium]